jgi:hypothetical protein
MVRFGRRAGSGAVIGAAAVGYAAARSVDPQYDQGVMLLAIAVACYAAFGPAIRSFVRDRFAAHG